MIGTAQVLLNSSINFSSNAGKDGPQKTPYLDTSHAVIGTTENVLLCCLIPKKGNGLQDKKLQIIK